MRRALRDIATCMSYDGIDPITMKPVLIAGGRHDPKLRRVLIPWFKQANWLAIGNR